MTTDDTSIIISFHFQYRNLYYETIKNRKHQSWNNALATENTNQYSFLDSWLQNCRSSKPVSAQCTVRNDLYLHKGRSQAREKSSDIMWFRAISVDWIAAGGHHLQAETVMQELWTLLDAGYRMRPVTIIRMAISGPNSHETQWCRDRSGKSSRTPRNRLRCAHWPLLNL